MKKCLMLTALLVIASAFLVGNVYADVTIYDDNAPGNWNESISLYLGDAWRPNPNPGPGTIVYESITTMPSGLTLPAGKVACRFNVIEVDGIGWSKMGSQRYGGTSTLDLTGYTSFVFDVAAYPTIAQITFGMGSTGPEDSCEKSKVFTNLGIASPMPNEGWTPVAFTFTPGVENMSAITNLWWFMIPGANQGQNIYVKNVKYMGGDQAIIKVTIDSGLIGVTVSGIMDFQGLVTGDAAVFSGDTETTITPAYNAGDEKFSVTNTGDIAETYSLEVLNPAGWSAVQGVVGATLDDVGTNEYRASAVFVTAEADASTALSDLDKQKTHALYATPDDKMCESTGRYSAGIASESGYNVASLAVRSLWIAFKPPLNTGIKTQAIKVGVIAEKYIP